VTDTIGIGGAIDAVDLDKALVASQITYDPTGPVASLVMAEGKPGATTDTLTYGPMTGRLSRQTVKRGDLDLLDLSYDYDSITRFLHVDPVEMNSVSLTDPQKMNLYAYVANDPINYLDPVGLQDVTCTRLPDGQMECTENIEITAPDRSSFFGLWGLGSFGTRQGQVEGANYVELTRDQKIDRVIDQPPMGELNYCATTQPSNFSFLIPHSFGIGLVGDAQLILGGELSLQFVFDTTGNYGIMFTPAFRAGADVNLSAGVAGFVSWAPNITNLRGGNIGVSYDLGALASGSVGASASLNPSSDPLGAMQLYPQVNASGGVGAAVGVTGEVGYSFLCSHQ
jgi:hypothetical protein